MNAFVRVTETVGNSVALLGRSTRWLPSILRREQAGRFVMHCGQIGIQTLPIVGIMSFFIGAVLALQTGFAFRGFSGANTFLGSVVGLSMCRELGPVMTAFLLAGRVGSATTAELASMKVYSEVDKLHTMNIPPERILVMPRLLAALVMVPVLTLISIVIGWYGGMLVAQFVDFISLDSSLYWRSLREGVLIDDVLDGLVKAEIFGILVIIITCQEGLRTTGGPREVGAAVTRGVVSAMVAILLTDYFITRILI